MAKEDKEINQIGRKINNSIDYERHKEERKKKRRERYRLAKERAEKERMKQYRSDDIQIMMSLATYTKLNKEKYQIWFNFIDTFKKLTEDYFFNIEQIRTLVFFGEILVKDYDYTAKQEIRRGTSWKGLSLEEQNRLIKYWSLKRARKEQREKKEEREIEERAKELEDEERRKKFHEERGKIGCECSECQRKQEVKEQWEEQQKREEEKLLDELEDEEEEEKAECANCGKVRELNEDDVCQKCEKELGE